MLEGQLNEVTQERLVSGEDSVQQARRGSFLGELLVRGQYVCVSKARLVSLDREAFFGIMNNNNEKERAKREFLKASVPFLREIVNAQQLAQ